MKHNLTLGSLFDGSGGFPLGGLLSGITPVWASEIEPFPIRVTTKRMPFMKHYGDISTMDGSKVEPVDIITFGSPCTDMSVAGKRAGLEGQQSVLFYEAIRIVKEMRNATNGKYPRYIVWENVPGAFSSNKGEDFKAVLEAVIGVKEPNAEVPMPEKGAWAYADCYMGDGWSVAYRTLDAQFWGVPQRRKRIYLVADFRGRGAFDILFKSEGLSGYSAESFRAWQRTAGSVKTCTSATGFDGYNGDLTGDVSATIGVNCGMSSGRNGVVINSQDENNPRSIVESAGFCTEHSAKSRGIGYEEETSPTLRAGVVPATVYENHSQDTRYKGPLDTAPTVSATYGMGGNNQPFVVGDVKPIENHPADSRVKLSDDGKVQTLTSRMGTGGGNVPMLFCNWDGEQTAPTLTAHNAGGNQRMPDKNHFNCILQAFGISSHDSNAMKSSNPHSGVYEADTSRTLDENGGNPGCNQGGIAVVCVDQGGGKSSCSITEELAPTLACTHGGEPAVCIQGSMIGRDDKNGPQGNGINEDVSFTLNATDRHAVYAMTTGYYAQVTEEKAPTLLSRDYKDAAVVTQPSYGIGRDAFNQGQNALYKPCIEEELEPTLVAKGPGAIAHPFGFDPSASRDVGQYFLEDCGNTLVNGSCPGHHNGVVEPTYTVRRLTPTECARLQGFPDWWCFGLETPDPTMEDIRYWYDVFETHRKICGTSSKPKSLKQISRWLQKPHSDSAEYKMWGNGVALPCVLFVLSGIVWYTQNEQM